MKTITLALSIWVVVSTVVGVLSIIAINYIVGSTDKSIKLSNSRNKAIEMFLLVQERYIRNLPQRSAAILRIAQYLFVASGCSIIISLLLAMILRNVAS